MKHVEIIRTKHAERVKRKPCLKDPEGEVLIPPMDYIDATRKTLGVIDLDPSSSENAQKFIDAQAWYPAEYADSALAEPWGGRTFYHQHPNHTVSRFQVQKILRDYLTDRISSAVLLLNKHDWLRIEPLLLSFPLLVHYKRIPFQRYVTDIGKLARLNPSFNSVTVYLPAKAGSHFDEDSLAVFLEQFSEFGRIVIAEDLGDGWQNDALIATRRMSLRPVLTQRCIQRY